MNRGPIASEMMSATAAAMRTRIMRAAPSSASATSSRPTEREPFTRIASPGRTRRERELRRPRRPSPPTRRGRSGGRARRRRARRRQPRPRADLLVVARSLGPELGHLAQDRDRATAVRPLSRCASAARIATGFAFHASLIRRPPPGSSISWERQRENSTSTGSCGGSMPRASAAVSAAAAFVSLVAGREAEHDVPPVPAHVRTAVADLGLGLAEAAHVETVRNERLELGRILREDRHGAGRELDRAAPPWRARCSRRCPAARDGRARSR